MDLKNVGVGLGQGDKIPLYIRVVSEAGCWPWRVTLKGESNVGTLKKLNEYVGTDKLETQFPYTVYMPLSVLYTSITSSQRHPLHAYLIPQPPLQGNEIKPSATITSFIYLLLTPPKKNSRTSYPPLTPPQIPYTLQLPTPTNKNEE